MFAPEAAGRAMGTDLDHDAIRGTRDRTATRDLVAALRTADEAERARIGRTLLELADPAAESPLAGIVEDRSLSDDLRWGACDLLGDGWAPDPERTRRWFAEGDEVLRAGALGHMGRAEEDLLGPILAEPGHPLHRYAVIATSFGFDAARYVAPRLRALRHPDPAVRLAAARALFFDEPAAAEPELVCLAADPDEEVALAALDDLRYYPTRAVIRAVAAARDGDPRPAVREAAEETLADLAHEVAIVAATQGGRDAVLDWLAPVRDLLRLADRDLAPVARSAMPPPRDPPPPDPDADPRDPDPAVRERAAHRLAAEGDHEGLLLLLGDRSAWVRKVAAWVAARLPPDPRVARRLRELLERPENTGAHGSELVRSWVAHAGPAPGELLALVRDDDRESVRTAAIRELARIAPERVAELWWVLAEPVAVTWAPQLAVLHEAAELGLHPPEERVRPLRSVDHVHLVAALGALG